jgi:hypothetical protein
MERATDRVLVYRARMFEYVGHVYYNAHSSSPLVLGDFESMKRWPGSPDGSEGFVKFSSGKGAIFDLQLSSPDVFVESNCKLVLLAPLSRTGFKLEERFGRGLAKLQDAMTDALATTWHDDQIVIASGAVVIAIAYNATPVIGADTSHLDERCIAASVPRLPVAVPSTTVWADEPVGAHELAIVPIENGTYRITVGELAIDGASVARCRLERA